MLLPCILLVTLIDFYENGRIITSCQDVFFAAVSTAILEYIFFKKKNSAKGNDFYVTLVTIFFEKT